MSESEETKLYEVGYLLLPMIAEEVLPAEVVILRDVIEKHAGVIESAEIPKNRQLAYPIEKKIANKRNVFNQAYFGNLIFKALPEAVSAIKIDLEKQEHMLRLMLIETVPYEVPVPRIRREVESSTPSPLPQPLVDSPDAVIVKPVLTSEEIDKEVEGLIATVE